VHDAGPFSPEFSGAQKLSPNLFLANSAASVRGRKLPVRFDAVAV
jgi:hypothetical protein